MAEKGFSKETFDKMIGKLVKNIKPMIISREKNLSVGIIMLLFIVFNHDKKEELIDSFWKGFFEEDDELMECIDILYQFYCLICNIDLLLVQARSKFLTDPEEIAANDELRAQKFKEYLYEKKKIEKR